MILTTYLLKSVLSMALLMIFYRLFLESEKLHRFNRVFLLAAVVFSLAIPFVPVGISFVSNSIPGTADFVFNPSSELTTLEESSTAFSYSFLDLLLVAYLIGFGFTVIRFIRNISLLMFKAFHYDKLPYEGATLVLLNERISPFTFLSYIYVNKQEYEEGRIDQKLLSHELTHALENHSIDVLFVEVLKIVFWFNPLLVMYKTAIQLNHEFLADEAVIDQYQEVKTYQYLLLDTIKNNNKIYLASNINFHLTQKRLQMMTKESSSKRKRILLLGMVPLGLAMILAFGKPAEQQIHTTTDKIEQGDPSEKDRYFHNTLVHYKTADGRTKIISYKSLSADVKARIPLPPPPPPAPNQFGKKSVSVKSERTPLPKGTVIHLKGDGKIIIGNTDDGLTPPPPPPAPAPPVVVGHKTKGHTGIAPPPPPPPTLDDMLKDGAKVYIDGKLVDNDTARDIWENHEDKIATINVKKEKNGKKRIELITKE